MACLRCNSVHTVTRHQVKCTADLKIFCKICGKYSYGICSNIQEMRARHRDSFLKKHNMKLGFMSAFVKAAAFALQEQPVVNAGKKPALIFLSRRQPECIWSWD